MKIYRKRVAAIIANAKNEFLLVNLCAFDPKFYTIPGGGVEESESVEEAIYREINEELHIARSQLGWVGMCSIPVRTLFETKKLQRNGVVYDGMETVVFGFSFVGADTSIVIETQEIRSYRWVPFDALEDFLLFTEQLKSTQENIVELFGSNL